MGTEGGWPFIGIDLGTMLSADFAAAAVLISFGVVLGVATPLQLLVMTVLEITIFVINEVIGRSYIGAVDAGDTIFVHIFGAYFGLTVARVLARPDISKCNVGRRRCRWCMCRYDAHTWRSRSCWCHCRCSLCLWIQLCPTVPL